MFCSIAYAMLLATVHAWWPLQMLTSSVPTMYLSGGGIDLCISSTALRDRWEQFWWLICGDHWPIASTATITISSEALCVTVFQLSFEEKSFAVQFIPSILIMLLISVASQQPLFNKSNGFEMYWRPGYQGTNVNWFPKWCFACLALEYISSQFEQFLAKPKSSWCNISDCQSR